MRKLTLISFMLLLCAFSYAQTQSIKGTVVDGSGLGLPGVNVLEKGSMNGAITDVDGKFELQIEEAATKTLVFSSMGFTSIEIQIEDKTTIEITMAEEAIGLDEVVVTAFGIKRSKKALGYSVTQISGERLSESRDANFMNALTGKVAGVNISSPSTGASGSTRVIIRGATSMSGNNQPLYVIDGLPMDNTAQKQATKYGGQDWGGGISSINPDDIATMTVLKGNTAAALYGSRASNGVILITTKKGLDGSKGFGVEINSNIVWDIAYETTDPQYKYGPGKDGKRPQTYKEAFDNISSWGEKFDGKPVYQFDNVKRPYSAQKDNFNKFYRYGFTFTNTVSLYKNTKDLNYRFSMSDMKNNGIIESSDLKRNNFTLNVGSKHGNLSIEARAMYIKEEVNNRPRLSDATGNSSYAVIALPNTVDINDLKPGYYTKDEFKNGKIIHSLGDELPYSSNIWSQDPWFAANRMKTIDTKEKFVGSFDLKYDFTDNFFAKASVGTDYYNILISNIEPTGLAYAKEGKMTRGQNNYWETNAKFMLNYTKTISDISITTFAGIATNYHKNENITLMGKDFVTPFLYTPKNQKNQSSDYQFSKYQTNSVFGSAEFSWKSWIFLTFTGRNDWFSTLPEDNNSLFYPSVALSYAFSDMFKKSLPKFVTFGKVRASWAQVSGQANPYSLELTYSTKGQGHANQAMAGISQNTIPNPDLKPYSSTEWEVGSNIRFFDSRLGLDIAYYNRLTTDDIIQVQISVASGYKNAWMNIGELENKGIEFLLDADIVKSRDLTINLSINFSKNINKVVKLGEAKEPLFVSESRNGDAIIKHVVGEPFGSIMGYTYNRNDKGELIVDASGLPSKDGELKVLGNGTHDTNLGFSGNIKYKNFSFRFLIDSKFGGEIYSSTNSDMIKRGSHKNTLNYRETGLIVKGVTSSGAKNTEYINPSRVDDYYGRLGSISEEFIYDASFIKLREIAIGYKIPNSLISGSFINSASISAVGRNLLLLWSKVDNIDPESNYTSGNGQGIETYGLPPVRTFGLNINLKF